MGQCSPLTVDIWHGSGSDGSRGENAELGPGMGTCTPTSVHAEQTTGTATAHGSKPGKYVKT